MAMMRCSFAGSALAACLCVAAPSFGQEKAAPSALVGVTGKFRATVTGGDVSGFCDAAVLWLPDGNAVCYAITKAPKEKERYLYLLVIRTGLSKPGGGLGMSFETESAENVQHDRFEIKLLDNARRVKIAYRFKTDPKTFAVHSEESLVIGDLTPKPEGPRVILIDLMGNKPSYKAVKTAFPDPVPELADRQGKQLSIEERVRVLSRAIRELEENSPTVKGFLAPKPKGAKEAVRDFVYPDAKNFEEDREGPHIYHAKYTTPDKPEKVVEWYRDKAGLVGGEGIAFARHLEEGEASSVLDDSRRPGKTERHRGDARAVSIVILTKKTKIYLLNVVVSRAKDEDVTHLALTYLGLNEK